MSKNFKLKIISTVLCVLIFLTIVIVCNYFVVWKNKYQTVYSSGDNICYDSEQFNYNDLNKIYDNVDVLCDESLQEQNNEIFIAWGNADKHIKGDIIERIDETQEQDIKFKVLHITFGNIKFYDKKNDLHIVKDENKLDVTLNIKRFNVVTDGSPKDEINLDENVIILIIKKSKTIQINLQEGWS